MNDAPYTRARVRAGLLLEAAALLLLLAAGLALRLYRLGDQSLWWDDWNGIAHLSVPGFFDSILQAYRMNREHAPGYFAAAYLASPFFGTGEYGQRLFSVALSLATIPVIYGVGRRSFGPMAGFVAAMLFALSPTHVYHAQGLRNYPIEVLAAALALYAFLRMLEGDRRWLWCNIAALGALCLTHYFGIFAVMAQGCALLALPERRGLLRRWAPRQIAVLLPAGLWFVVMSQISASWQFATPSAAAVFEDLFGDDLAPPYGYAPWAFTVAGWSSGDMAVQSLMRRLMMTAMTAVCAWSALHVTRASLRPGGPEAMLRRDRALALLALWVLPVLLLLVLALVYRPLVSPRYTIYACLGAYALAGGAVWALRRRALQGAAIAAFAALYAYQLALALPIEQRTTWRALGNDLAARAKPGDLVLVGAYGPANISTQTLLYHLPAACPAPVVNCDAIAGVLAHAQCHFRAHAADPEPPRVWYVLNTHFHRAPPTAPEQYFRANGIEFETTNYPVYEALVLFSIAAWPGAASGAPWVRPIPEGASYEGFDYRGLMRRLEIPDTPENLWAIERVWDDGIFFGGDVGTALTLAPMLADDGSFALAEHCARRAAGSQPPYSPDPYALWYAAMSRGDLALARELLPQLPEYRDIESGEAAAPALTRWACGDHAGARTAWAAARPRLEAAGYRELSVVDALLDAGPAAAREAAAAARRTLRPYTPGSPNLLYRLIGLEAWVSPCATPWQPAGATAR